MKNAGFVTVGGFALLQLASASSGCCRARDLCLKAVNAPEYDGASDCSSRLVVTVTPSTSTVTETLTSVESAVATELLAETITETVSTETILFSATATVTAYTETDVVLATTTTPVTVTVASLAPSVTVTLYGYAGALTARDVAPSDVPDYASSACVSWEEYVSACQCAGVEPTTITASAPVTTVTVPADDVLTSTVATQSITETDIVSLIATASSTETDTVSVTETVTATQTDIASSTTTVIQVTTPTVTVSAQCQATGLTFRAYSPISLTTAYMLWVPLNTAQVAWVGAPIGYTGSLLVNMLWVLNADGYMELNSPLAGATAIQAPYISLASTDSAQYMSVKSREEVDAGVTAGIYARVKGCVNPTSDALTLSAAGRSLMYYCNGAAMISNSNVPPSSSCVQVALTGN